MEEVELNEEQIDALREIGNIGAGNAAIALSELLNKKILINVPKVRLLSIEKLSESDFLMDSSEVGIAVFLKILGGIKGGMLVLFSQKNALLMIDVLLERDLGPTQFLTSMDTSAISESAHILSSSYLHAVGEFVRIQRLIPSVSGVVVDKMSRLKELLVKGFAGSTSNYILPIENHLVIEGKEIVMFVVFLLEYESVKKILNIFGL